MEEEGDGSPEPCPLPLQRLPGAKVRIHKHRPSNLTGYAQEEGMKSGSQLDNFIRPFSSRSLGGAGRGKLYWESTTTSPLTAQPSLLSLDSSPAGGGGREETGKHQTRPFHQLPQVPIPRGASSLMLDPLFFNSRIAEGAPVGTQKQSRSMNSGTGGGILKN